MVDLTSHRSSHLATVAQSPGPKSKVSHPRAGQQATRVVGRP